MLSLPPEHQQHQHEDGHVMTVEGGEMVFGGQREQNRRVRREIANSNERRRMQSINAGFKSLRTLLPHSDGHKLSKAAILQQTAEYVFVLESDKLKLLNQIDKQRRLCKCGALKPGGLFDLSEKDEGIGSPREEEIEDVRRDVIEVRNQLDKERRMRMVMEEKVRELEAELYPEKLRALATKVASDVRSIHYPAQPHAELPPVTHHQQVDPVAASSNVQNEVVVTMTPQPDHRQPSPRNTIQVEVADQQQQQEVAGTSSCQPAPAPSAVNSGAAYGTALPSMVGAFSSFASLPVGFRVTVANSEQRAPAAPLQIQSKSAPRTEVPRYRQPLKKRVVAQPEQSPQPASKYAKVAIAPQPTAAAADSNQQQPMLRLPPPPVVHLPPPTFPSSPHSIRTPLLPAATSQQASSSAAGETPSLFFTPPSSAPSTTYMTLTRATASAPSSWQQQQQQQHFQIKVESPPGARHQTSADKPQYLMQPQQQHMSAIAPAPPAPQEITLNQLNSLQPTANSSASSTRSGPPSISLTLTQLNALPATRPAPPPTANHPSAKGGTSVQFLPVVAMDKVLSRHDDSACAVSSGSATDSAPSDSEECCASTANVASEQAVEEERVSADRVGSVTSQAASEASAVTEVPISPVEIVIPHTNPDPPHQPSLTRQLARGHGSSSMQLTSGPGSPAPPVIRRIDAVATRRNLETIVQAIDHLEQQERRNSQDYHVTT